MRLDYNDSGYQQVERLPLKAVQEERAMQTMTGKPATEKQIAAILRKGYALTEKSDRAMASRVIFFLSEHGSLMQQTVDALVAGGYIRKAA